MNNNTSSVTNELSNKLKSLEASLTEAHVNADNDTKEKIENAMISVIEASNDLNSK